MSTIKFARSNSYRVPTSNGSALQIQHCGWLRKQGGKFRTWKRRFFILRQGSLEFYADSEQIRFIGALEIGPSDTMEVVACETDANSDDKAFNFIVKKSKTWGSEQRHSFVLSASSANERRDWIRALRKQLYLKLGGGLFGTHLSEVFAYTSPETNYVPRVVYETAEFIRNNGMTTDGIFRKCGSRHVIEELCESYDMARPDPILNPNEHDPHAAAGVLKQYLRELPEPVIPYRQYDRLKATGYLIEDGQDLKPIIEQLECLPAPNYSLLQFLCHLLSEVADHSEENRMTVDNLASVFAPNILGQADYDPDVEMSVTPVITLTIAGFIRHHEELFRYDLTHFSQLHSAALSATTAGAAGIPVSMPLQCQAQKKHPQSPSNNTAELITSSRISRHKSDSLVDSPTSQPQGQIWFPHEARRGDTMSRQITITGISSNLKLNGCTSSADCDFSSGESGGSLKVAKTGSSSPVGGDNSESGILNAATKVSTTTSVAEQLRHLRSVALVARAETVCEQAKSRALAAELARARCDLNMAETELGLLRKRLSFLETALAASRPSNTVMISSVGPGSSSTTRNFR